MFDKLHETSTLLLSLLQTTSLNSTICKIGDYVDISVQVIPPQDQVIIFWRLNKTQNWTVSPIECSMPGKKDVYVMAENAISVLTSECFEILSGN